ncbi:MAG: sulfur carrier protein ThiS [Gammaproteobacteria bacterium]|jgi:sulfur carrier protein|nr:sulfur carrier protein ThiS [Gammaproteobacteria bacterium]|tara:strand:- start:330 stop:530 length:201 start_codon:yes stop_codon:yes gene_type:complete
MNILINGKKFFSETDLTISEFLKKNNISENNIVVEINKEIITKNLWEKYKLNNNDKVEIITAVGGG